MDADFVIVGAGSAGCVLAERLSASGRFSVLVLEAGGSDRRMWVRIPLGYGKTYKDPRVNWMFRIQPDPGLDGRCDYWPRGKIVGGSSSINAMVYYELTASRGQRCSAADAFLRPALQRPNVALITGAHATGIDSEGDKAVAVRARRGGAELRIRANREVILCAGAIKSPQLLMLSGVGDEEHLSQLGIPVRLANSNVGRNMQDHLGANHFYECARPTLNQILRPWWGKLAVGARYVLSRSGPLALGVNHAGGFVASGLDGERLDIQLYFQPISTIQDRPGDDDRAAGE